MQLKLAALLPLHATRSPLATDARSASSYATPAPSLLLKHLLMIMTPRAFSREMKRLPLMLTPKNPLLLGASPLVEEEKVTSTFEILPLASRSPCLGKLKRTRFDRLRSFCDIIRYEE